MGVTKGGVVLCVVGAVLYGIAWVTQVGWFYVADSFVWAAVAVNLAMPWLSLGGLSVRRRLAEHRPSGRGGPEGVFEGDSIGLDLELRNQWLIPRFLVVVEERCPLASPEERDKGFLVAGLGPKARSVLSYETSCYRRSHYRFPPVELMSSTPFGFFRASRKVDAPLEITVYPQALPVRLGLRGDVAAGRLPSPARPRASGEFRGAREFQTGDQLRSIHWRSSARRGQLMVKEFDDAPRSDVYLAFNPAMGGGDDRENPLEYSIRIAASLARLCFQEGRAFRMSPSPWDGPAPSWRDLLEYLARLEPGEPSSLWDALDNANPAVTTLMVVSAADKDALGLLAGRLQGRGPSLTILLEGFGESEDCSSAAGRLAGGTAVVRCRKGELKETLESLTTALRPAAPLPDARLGRTG